MVMIPWLIRDGKICFRSRFRCPIKPTAKCSYSTHLIMMLRGGRLFKSVASFSNVSRVATASKLPSATLFMRLQSTQSTESTQSQQQDADSTDSTDSTASQSKDFNQRTSRGKPPLSPEEIARRKQEFLDVTQEIETGVRKGIEANQSSGQLTDFFFESIDKTHFLKDTYKAKAAFSKTIDLLIAKSVKEMSDPTIFKVPITPEEVLKKAILYGVASAPNFENVAKYHLRQAEPQDVLHLWVSFVEYKAVQGSTFLWGENELIASTIIAYSELIADQNQKPQIEQINKLLNGKRIPRLFELLRHLKQVFPVRNERSNKIENIITMLMLATRVPNSLKDLKRAHEAAVNGNLVTLRRILNEIQDISKAGGTPLSQETLVAFMTCYNLVHRPLEVFSVWNQILASGTKPSVEAWNQLLEASAKGGPYADRVGQAQGVFDKIPTPNADTYAKLYEIYVKFGENQAAKDLITEENLKSSSFVNVYLRSLASGTDFETLQKELRKFQNSDISIQSSTYNKLLSHFVAGGHFSTARRLLNEMEAQDIKPDVATFSIIFSLTLKSIASKGDIPTEAVIEECLKDMEQSGVEINNYTLTSIMDSLAKDPSLYGYAELLFQKLKSRNQVNIVSYVSMISNAFRLLKIEVAEKYLKELLKSGLSTTPSLWAMVFDGWHQNRNPEKALEYLERVQASPKHKSMLNKFSYFHLLKLAKHENSKILANRVLDVIEENKAGPHLSEYSKGIIKVMSRNGIQIPPSIQKEIGS